jgi:diguanylate cyclase (GGDEF)-like protein/PAS domain S-box-containing protein
MGSPRNDALPEELVDSEALHRQTFETSRAPQLLIEPGSQRIVEANAAACELYGYGRDELTKKLLGETCAMSAEEVSRALALATATQERSSSLRQRLASGDVRDVEVHWGPLEVGGRRFLHAIVHDVTERKRVEKIQSALFEISETTSNAQSTEELYRALHEIVGRLMYAKNFYIALRDESGRISFPYFVDQGEPPPGSVEPGKGLTDYVMRTGEPLLASPEVFAELAARGEVENVGAPSVDWLGVPLKRGDTAAGVLVVQTYTDSIRFTEADKDLLTFVSQHVAAAIDRKRAADALRESEAKFRAVAETAPCAILIYQGTKIQFANEAAARISGRTREEVLSSGVDELLHPDFRQLVRDRALARQRGESILSRYEAKFVRGDGEERWVDVSATSIEFGGRPAAVATAFDVTERKRAEAQVRSLAYHDALTGLPNRRLFNDRLSVALAQAHRLRHRVAVLFLDLDHFKVINDSLGHDLGDRLLRTVAERLQSAVREGDTVARLAGDEFTLLLPGVTQTVDPAKVAEKILESLRLPLQLHEHELKVTASLGISVYPEDGRDPETLVRNADAAMYRAKEQGRDNYQLCSAAMNVSALERLALENDLREALPRGEMTVHYQAVVSTFGKRVRGVEALLHWQHPERGVIPHSEFGPIAELTGQVLELAPWLLKQSCAQTRTWQRAGFPDLRLGVRLCERQLEQRDLVPELSDVLLETALPPSCLELEIGPGVPLQGDAMVARLRAIKARGIQVTIDGFGLAAAAVADLKRLPIDAVRIDPELIGSVTSNEGDAAIVSAIIAMARTLELCVVAAGVETEEQLAFLSARGCQFAQGPLFAPPLPVEECEAVLLGLRDH